MTPQDLALVAEFLLEGCGYTVPEEVTGGAPEHVIEWKTTDPEPRFALLRAARAWAREREANDNTAPPPGPGSANKNPRESEKDDEGGLTDG